MGRGLRKVTVVIAPFVLVGLSACSRLKGSSEPEDVSSTPEKESSSFGATEMGPTVAGALAGGALGAGLGAIIGSVSGSAGGGLAIGMAAGAPTGAIIGNQFEKTNAAQSEQTERLNRQQQQIDSQQREIDEMKRRNSDGGMRSSMRRGNTGRSIGTANNNPGNYRRMTASSSEVRGVSRSSFNRPSTFEGDSLDRYHGNPRAQSFSLSSAAAPSSRAHYRTTAVKSAPAPVVAKVSEPVTEKVKTAGTDIGEAPAAISTPPAQPVAALPPARVEEPKKHAPVPTPVASATGSSGFDCEQARGEADRARRAVSDADRLFYYRRALKLCPSDAKYHLEMGQVYSSIGRKDDAKFELQQALDLEPGNLQVQQELAALEGR